MKKVIFYDGQKKCGNHEMDFLFAEEWLAWPQNIYFGKMYENGGIINF